MTDFAMWGAYLFTISDKNIIGEVFHWFNLSKKAVAMLCIATAFLVEVTRF